MEKVSVAEVKKNFSEFLSAAGYGNKGFIITRRGKEIAALIGLKELKALRAKGNTQFKGLSELAGNWDEGDEFSSGVQKIYKARKDNIGRSIEIGIGD
jgi:prevent-host-death family protein